jgi:hypothetical protein
MELSPARFFEKGFQHGGLNAISIPANAKKAIACSIHTAAILAERVSPARRVEMPFWITSRRRVTIPWGCANIFCHSVSLAACGKVDGLGKIETKGCGDDACFFENCGS